MQNQNNAACLLGALVADAAALGQHWIYDVERIASVTANNDGKAAFVAIEAQNYEGVRSYFAHGKREDGMLSQYGVSLRIALQSMIKHNGKFDVPDYQQTYVDTFGAGGTYQGYIDRPTRGSLENITNEILDPSGVDDDQLPATTRLPAIIVAYKSSDNLAAEIETAIRVTNTNKDTSAHSQLFANILTRVLEGADVTKALKAGAEETSGALQQSLKDALTTDETNSIAYGEITGRACHLPNATPLMFHILKHSSSYVQAVETNIKAGGDNCGRATMIGAIMAARYGLSEQNGIPLEWILKTHDAPALWHDCQTLAELA